jgi:Lrp/AsnC family transcriptional regulator, regulator for asnA, asnC and gidA
LTRCEAICRNSLALRGQPAPKQAISQGRRGPVSHAPRLDAVDKSIIEALQKNGRESFRRIAAQIGVSEATVRARYARLCSNSILQVTGVTNPLGLGFEAMAMVGIRVTGPPEPVAEEIGSWAEAGYVVITAGQFDLLVELVCEDRRDLLDVTNRIRGLGEVASTETFLYLDLWKQLYDWGAHVTGGTSDVYGGPNGR